MTPEGIVKDSVKALLKRYKAHYFMPVSNGMGRAGVSDFIGCYKGLFFAIETKSPTGKPTALQLKYLGEIEASGGRSFIVRDEHSLSVIENWLKRII